MNAETQLYAALAGRPALVLLVVDRIYPDAIPEGKTLPAVVYMRAGTVPTHTIGGTLVCEDVRFAITAWAATRAESEVVADEIAAALAFAGQPKADRSGGYDNETGLFAAAIEVDWFWTA